MNQTVVQTQVEESPCLGCVTVRLMRLDRMGSQHYLHDTVIIMHQIQQYTIYVSM